MSLPETFGGAFEQLHETAMAAAGGLDDFGLGCDDYRAGLRCFLEAVDETPVLPLGREQIQNTVIGSLVARLVTQQGWRDHPECLRNPISRPLIITGIPRTGTTALHKLMSMDPQFQGVELWLSNAPMPRPPRETWPGHPLYQATADGIAQVRELMPDFHLVHDMVPDEVDECLEVLKHSFVSNRWGSTYVASDYDRYFMQQDERDSYRRYADTLRLIGANDPTTPWLLKNPGHIWHMEALIEQFPDACIVQTHRDPSKAIPSVCSVIQMTRALAHGDAAVPEMLGAREMDYWTRGIERMMRYRDGLAEDPVHDVIHRDFHADPLSVVQGIYDRFGYELRGDVVDRMRGWMADHDEAKQHQHQYTPEQFGLSVGELRERFSGYIERFDLL